MKYNLKGQVVLTEALQEGMNGPIRRPNPDIYVSPLPADM